MQNQAKDFVHSLYTNAFYTTIRKPTRVTEHSATLLDNTSWTNNPSGGSIGGSIYRL